MPGGTEIQDYVLSLVWLASECTVWGARSRKGLKGLETNLKRYTGFKLIGLSVLGQEVEV